MSPITVLSLFDKHGKVALLIACGVGGEDKYTTWAPSTPGLGAAVYQGCLGKLAAQYLVIWSLWLTAAPSAGAKGP